MMPSRVSADSGMYPFLTLDSLRLFFSDFKPPWHLGSVMQSFGKFSEFSGARGPTNPPRSGHGGELLSRGCLRTCCGHCLGASHMFIQDRLHSGRRFCLEDQVSLPNREFLTESATSRSRCDVGSVLLLLLPQTRLLREAATLL